MREAVVFFVERRDVEAVVRFAVRLVAFADVDVADRRAPVVFLAAEAFRFVLEPVPLVRLVVEVLVRAALFDRAVFFGEAFRARWYRIRTT